MHREGTRRPREAGCRDLSGREGPSRCLLPACEPRASPSPLPGLPGCSESEDGPEEGAEGRPAEVSLEEALVRLAEFLSVQLGAEESFGNPPDLTKVSRAGDPSPAHRDCPQAFWAPRAVLTSASVALVLVSFTADRCPPTVDGDRSALGSPGVDSEPQGKAGPVPGDSASR